MRSSARRVIMRTGRDSPRWGPNTSMADGCFNRDVLGIQPSDLHQIAREPTRGIMQGSARSSGHSTSRIRRSTAGQVSSHDRMVRDFMIWGRQARPRGLSRAHNRALTRNDTWQCLAELHCFRMRSSARRAIMRPGEIAHDGD